MCGPESLTLDIGDSRPLTSLHYPDPYRNNMECLWQIIVPNEHRVVIAFEAFSLAPEDDSLCIMETTPSESRLFYSYYYPPQLQLDVVSLSNSLTVQFVSDPLHSDVGFSLLLTVTDEIGT